MKKGTNTGARPRIKNTAFVSREGATSVTIKRGEVVKTWKGKKGKILKRTTQPLAPKPEKFGDAFKRFKKTRAKKGKRRFMMVRRAGAAGQTGGAQFTDLSTLEHYKEATSAQIEAKETDRLMRQGMGLRAARKKAKELAADVVDSWYVADYEEDAEAFDDVDDVPEGYYRYKGQLIELEDDDE
ncbi:MAG: hypothetical protein ACREUQ_07435 [Burkholderiales bacterium]